MTHQPLTLPLFNPHDGLGAFLGDLRAWVFHSKKEAARYFGVAHTTIMRYEQDQIRCPPSYIAALAMLILERRTTNHQSDVQHQLLRLLNVVFQQYGFKPLVTWAEVVDLASRYGKPAAPRSITISSHELAPPCVHHPHYDWGEAPDIEHFVGRSAELNQLTTWINDNHCRVLAILGLGGMGKTTLIIELARRLKPTVAVIIWRSLTRPLSANEYLLECLHRLEPNPVAPYPPDFQQRLNCFLAYLTRYRCLLILDNFESVLRSDYPAGQYHQEYQAYAELLTALSQRRHQSCIIITSREKPVGFNHLQSDTTRTLSLTGFAEQDTQIFLQSYHLHGNPASWQRLTMQYIGNPLTLKLVAQSIQTLFAGDIAAFLSHQQLLVGDIRTVLNQHLNRLSEHEQEIMYWLSIERQPVTIATLKANLVRSPWQHVLLETLESLVRRSLIEQHSSGFWLHGVILEYLNEWFIDQIVQEIRHQQPHLLMRHAFLKADAITIIREQQRQAIIQPIIHHLLLIDGREQTIRLLQALLTSFNARPMPEMGYAPGNILNLCLELQTDLNQFDFRFKPLWQVNLHDRAISALDLTGCDLAQTHFMPPFGGLIALAQSPDGSLVAGGSVYGEMLIWETHQFKLRWSIAAHHDWIRALIFSPDGQHLASASDDGVINIWQLPDLTCMPPLTGHVGRVLSLTFDPTGQYLFSGGEDGYLRVWDWQHHRLIARWQAHNDWICSIALSSDGQTLASAGKDRVINLWHPQTYEHQGTLHGHQGTVWSLVFSPKEPILLSAGSDRSIHIWDYQGQKLVKHLHGHHDAVFALQFSTDGRYLASGGADQHIRLWDMERCTPHYTINAHTHWIRSLLFCHATHDLISISSDRSLRVWEVMGGRLRHQIQGHDGVVWDLAISTNDHTLISCGEQQPVTIWELGPEPRHGYGLPDETKDCKAIAYSPHGHVLAIAKAHTIQLWPLQEGQPQTYLNDAQGWIRAISFSPDGQWIAACGEDHGIYVWERTTGLLRHCYHGHHGWVWSLAWSPDSRYLASGGDDHTIRLWSPDQSTPIALLTGHQNSIWAIAFSPDGQRLVSGCDDHTIRIWDHTTGYCQRIITNPDGQVWAVDWHPHGHWIATGGPSTNVYVWDATTGQPYQCLSGHVGRVRSVRFRQDGSRLFCGNGNATISVWDIHTGEKDETLAAYQPYAGFTITAATGLTPAQRSSLEWLGAATTRVPDTWNEEE